MTRQVTAPRSPGPCTSCGETPGACSSHRDGACCATCEVRTTHLSMDPPPLAGSWARLLRQQCPARLVGDDTGGEVGRCDLRLHSRYHPHAVERGAYWVRWLDGGDSSWVEVG